MMTDNPNEGNLEGVGGSGANQNPSAPAGQPLEADFTTLNATLVTLSKKLEAQDGEIRALKSGKDKAVDRALSEIGPVKESIAKIAKYLKVDEEQVRIAQREAVLDALVDERNSGSQPLPVSGQDGEVGRVAELQNIETALGLPPNDPRVTDLKIKYATNPAAFALEGAKLKASLSSGQPTPAEEFLPQGKGTPQKPDTQAMISELSEWQKTPSKFKEQINARVKELDARGWN
jgi:hypothetical protein